MFRKSSLSRLFAMLLSFMLLAAPLTFTTGCDTLEELTDLLDDLDFDDFDFDDFDDDDFDDFDDDDFDDFDDDDFDDFDDFEDLFDD